MSVQRPGLLVVEVGAELADGERDGLAAAGFFVETFTTEERGDRDALRALTTTLGALRARPDVDGERVALLGLERGATLAFLQACQASGAAAVVMWGGELVRDSLDAERPFQPLEMALGLEAPLQAHVAADSPAGAPARLGVVREALSQFARPFDIVVHPGAGFDEAARAAALRDSLEFLRTTLELTGGS